MHRFVILLLGIAIFSPQLSFAQAPEADDAEATVDVEGEGTEEAKTEQTDSTEQPNEEGQKEITLEDLQLWSSIDMDKDGKLTVAEFDRFIRSPSSRNFVHKMKEEKAIQDWADKVGIDIAKAKQAMAIGAQAQARANVQRNRAAAASAAQRQRIAAIQAEKRRRQSIQNSYTNYFANLGKRYYHAMSRKRRDEL